MWLFWLALMLGALLAGYVYPRFFGDSESTWI